MPAFTEDSRAENYITKLGAKYTYEQLDFDVLHEDWDRQNLGRHGAAKNDDAIQEYALRMESGEPAPAVIMIKDKDGYLILDGVQRLAAAQLNDATSFSAYVLSPRTGTKIQSIIRVCANSMTNGTNAPAKSQLVRTAVSVLLLDLGCSVKEIATSTGQSEETIKTEVRFQKTDANMRKTGWNGKLNKYMTLLIGKHADPSDWSQAPGPLGEFLYAVEEAKLINGSADEAVERMFDIKRIKTKDRSTQLGTRLNEFKRDPSISMKLNGTPGADELTQLLMRVKAAATTGEKCIKKGKQIHDEQFAAELARNIQKLYSAVKRITPQELMYPNGGGMSSIYSKG